MALVFVDRPGRFIDADAILTDKLRGCGAAVEHLVAAGHQRIGFLGDRPDLYTAAERLRGFEAGLARHASDNVKAGEQAGKTMCELVKAQGKSSGQTSTTGS